LIPVVPSVSRNNARHAGDVEDDPLTAPETIERTKRVLLEISRQRNTPQYKRYNQIESSPTPSPDFNNITLKKRKQCSDYLPDSSPLAPDSILVNKHVDRLKYAIPSSSPLKSKENINFTECSYSDIDDLLF
jgi:hypothetical protein